ncbi:MAG: 4-(cytidine 5'-diphospho)-2-C-methyl-D-erythritol kinase [Neisseriaceae bacterium]
MINYFLCPAKLNLRLHITGQRKDGYHLLDSIFILINLFDVLEIKPITEKTIRLTSNLSSIKTEENLVFKAASLLQKEANLSEGVHLHLHKNIPLGAGLGGASSNAATTLIALNSLWQLNYSTSDLMSLSLQLGADVPFFIRGENAHVSGIGEIIQPISLPTSHYLVIYPNFSISTTQIFQALSLTQHKTTRIIAHSAGPRAENDLQEVAFRLYPDLKRVRDFLGAFGHPVMTGSGSCLFIEVDSVQEYLAIKPDIPEGWWSVCVQTLGQHPLNGLKE